LSNWIGNFLVYFKCMDALKSLGKDISEQAFIRANINCSSCRTDEFIEMRKLGSTDSAKSVQLVGKRQLFPGGQKRTEDASCCCSS
jgi:hypothetical protein